MRSVRIGNGCGFWGDNLDAPIRLVETGRLDYLTLEYLAELTMSILALQKQKDLQAGYATDFVDVLTRLIPCMKRQPSLRIVTNAGGMNPRACAMKCREVLDRAALSERKIGVVTGDDLMPRLEELLTDGYELRHLDTNVPLHSVRDRVVSANAYLGARPICEAIRLGAAVIITGRVADASLTVGPAVHELGWDFAQLDLLAAATVAGHLIECGAQVTGGLWTDWQAVENLADVGYPIAEIRETGEFDVTKPPGSGGAVNRETVIEQLLYEVGDPAHYLTPDVVADFTSVSLIESERDRISIRDCRGQPATESYKVSVAYRDGFTCSGTLVIAGPDAREKADYAGRMILQRLERIGYKYEKSLVECIGVGACAPGVLPMAIPNEVVLRVGVRDSRRGAVERFSREFAPLVTSGPPGVTGYTSGRPPVREVFAYWPCLIEKTLVDPWVRVEVI